MGDRDGRAFVRPPLGDAQHVPHGSVTAVELATYGLSHEDVLDFSVNTNPLGPAPGVLRAVRAADWTRYPGDDEEPLRCRLAAASGVDPEQVVLGNGSVELIWLLALAVLRPGDTVAVRTPTFGEYARAARVAGAHVVGFRDLEAIPSARLLFVCNPNNPTGEYLERRTVERLLDVEPERLLVLDEAYAPFVARRWESEPLLERGNLAVLRSMTKDQALPGLRLGYLLAPTALARAARAAQPPWSVNAGALRAGLAALDRDAQAHLARARSVVDAGRSVLETGLRARGYGVWPSAANFILVDVGHGAAFRRVLLPQGIVVRDAASFGLPSCVRIACRAPGDCGRLLDAVQRAGLHAR